jgi:uncharacterized OsmC-like protein
MSMRITQLKGAYRVRAELSGLEIVSGRDDRESDYEGPSPSDLLEASLGTCVGLELAAYLNRRYGIDEGGFTIAVRAVDEGDTTEFVVDVDLNHDFDDRQLGRIRDVMESCGICDIIKHAHSVEVNLKSPRKGA